MSCSALGVLPEASLSYAQAAPTQRGLPGSLRRRPTMKNTRRPAIIIIHVEGNGVDEGTAVTEPFRIRSPGLNRGFVK